MRGVESGKEDGMRVWEAPPRWQSGTGFRWGRGRAGAGGAGGLESRQGRPVCSQCRCPELGVCFVRRRDLPAELLSLKRQDKVRKARAHGGGCSSITDQAGEAASSGGDQAWPWPLCALGLHLKGSQRPQRSAQSPDASVGGTAACGHQTAPFAEGGRDGEVTLL